MSLPIIVLGAGGHARVLIDALRSRSAVVLGIAEADHDKHGQMLFDIPIIGDEGAVLSFAGDSVHLVNGIGTVRVSLLRRRLYDSFKSKGYCFATVVHASAVVAPNVVLAEGAQIMAGAVLQTGCRIGENAIINTRVAVDHDCVIGNHVHVSPGATLCGDVVVGDGSHVGAGSTVIQGIRIGRDSMVAAGAVVIRDVPDNATVAGVPAREIKS